MTAITSECLSHGIEALRAILPNVADWQLRELAAAVIMATRDDPAPRCTVRMPTHPGVQCEKLDHSDGSDTLHTARGNGVQYAWHMGSSITRK